MAQLCLSQPTVRITSQTQPWKNDILRNSAFTRRTFLSAAHHLDKNVWIHTSPYDEIIHRSSPATAFPHCPPIDGRHFSRRHFPPGPHTSHSKHTDCILSQQPIAEMFCLMASNNATDHTQRATRRRPSSPSRGIATLYVPKSSSSSS